MLEYTGHRARLRFRPDMPTGPANRVADNALAKRLLGWEPTVPFREGLRRTIDWYVRTRDPKHVSAILERLLTERIPQDTEAAPLPMSAPASTISTVRA